MAKIIQIVSQQIVAACPVEYRSVYGLPDVGGAAAARAGARRGWRRGRRLEGRGRGALRHVRGPGGLPRGPRLRRLPGTFHPGPWPRVRGPAVRGALRQPVRETRQRRRVRGTSTGAFPWPGVCPTRLAVPPPRAASSDAAASTHDGAFAASCRQVGISLIFLTHRLWYLEDKRTPVIHQIVIALSILGLRSRRHTER